MKAGFYILERYGIWDEAKKLVWSFNCFTSNGMASLLNIKNSNTGSTLKKVLHRTSAILCFILGEGVGDRAIKMSPASWVRYNT